MKADERNMDILINSYIDGELSPRQHLEFKRMLENDTTVKAKYQEVLNVRTLVHSVERAVPAEDIGERVRSILERKTLFGEVSSVDRPRPVRHLILRKLAAAAAVVLLVGVLSSLVYSIYAPQGGASVRGLASNLPEAATHGPAPAEQGGALYAKLELHCASVGTIDAFLGRSLEYNGLSNCVAKQAVHNGYMYRLTCRQDALDQFLMDISSAWPKLNDAVLYLNTGQLDITTRVGSVSARQVARIMGQSDAGKSIEVARSLAAQNSIDEMTYSGRALAYLDDPMASMPVVPKPMLTSPEPRKNNRLEETGGGREVELTILIEKP